MGNKSIGTTKERELLRPFFDTGGSALRCAGSGSIQLPAPDILGLLPGRVIAIEAKYTTEGRAYLQRQEAKQLQRFADSSPDGEAWVAFRIARRDWRFIPLDDAPRTKSDNITLKYSEIDRQGYTFNELLEEV
jgi:Holliday junction resolvase